MDLATTGMNQGNTPSSLPSGTLASAVQCGAHYASVQAAQAADRGCPSRANRQEQLLH